VRPVELVVKVKELAAVAEAEEPAEMVELLF
jgi:hypothetical protein